MDPKQLGEKFANMVATTAATAAEKQQLNRHEKEARIAASDAVIEKLENVVLPFLEETKKAFLGGAFAYRRQNDLNTRRLLGVTFTIKGFPPVEIRDLLGKVIVRQMGHAPGKKDLLIPVFTYSSDADPFIGTSDDLTREKIGRLIEMVMDNASRS